MTTEILDTVTVCAIIILAVCGLTVVTVLIAACIGAGIEEEAGV